MLQIPVSLAGGISSTAWLNSAFPTLTEDKVYDCFCKSANNRNIFAANEESSAVCNMFYYRDKLAFNRRRMQSINSLYNFNVH